MSWRPCSPRVGLDGHRDHGRRRSTYRLVRELTGATAEQARDFLARGMLINTLVALEIPEHLDEHPDAAELLACTLAKGDSADQADRVRPAQRPASQTIPATATTSPNASVALPKPADTAPVSP